MHVAWVNLTNGGLSGGSRKHLAMLLPRLVADSRVTRLDMLSPDAITDFPRLDGVASDWRWPSHEKWLGFPSVKKRIRLLAPDVVFIPTARWVDPSGAASVVMVRNMEPLLRSNEDSPPIERLVNMGRKRAAAEACARADRVIAVSDFVATYLHHEWHIPSAKLTRIYHGLDEPDASIATPPAQLRNGAPDFLFLAGSLRPTRGIEDGLQAFAALYRAFPNLLLVIAGAVEGRVNTWIKGVHELAESLGVADRVCWTGRLTQSEMNWCFSRCRAFLMTSRVEACPNTALEAMSHGALIVSTHNSPMPEFFGTAAAYYQAGDYTQLADRIRELFHAPSAELNNRRAESVTAAATFNWDACADLTIRELLRASNKGATDRRR